MIRPMEKKDRDAVLRIVQDTDMFTPVEISYAEEQIDIYLSKPNQRDYFLVIVENEKQEVIGYMSYGPTPLTEGAYDLYWMAIAPEEQGHGYGKELMRWLEKQVQESKGRVIVVETSSQTKYHLTRQFYLNLGYKEASRIPDFYKPGDDRIIYVKYIT